MYLIKEKNSVQWQHCLCPKRKKNNKQFFYSSFNPLGNIRYLHTDFLAEHYKCTQISEGFIKNIHQKEAQKVKIFLFFSASLYTIVIIREVKWTTLQHPPTVRTLHSLTSICLEFQKKLKKISLVSMKNSLNLFENGSISRQSNFFFFLKNTEAVQEIALEHRKDANYVEK